MGPALSSAQQVEFDSQYQQGESLYAARKYDEAIKCFQRALAIKPDPNVLYNIAQSYRKLGQNREAKAHFEWFLRIPNGISAAERQSVEEIVTELGEKIRREEAAKLVYVQAAAPRRPKWRVALGIIGMATGAALVGFGGLFASAHGQPVLENGKRDFTRVYNTTSLAAGLMTPGAVLIVGGAVLVALPGEKKSDLTALPSPMQTIGLVPAGNGAGVVFGRSF